MGYDVVVVGTRVAGAATALLLARAGLRVLALDRARFPSDTVSSHQVQVPGGACLRRWGLLDKLAASGCPPTRELHLDTGDVVLRGRYPEVGGVDALYSPRRTVLDALLVDAARDAGAEVREGTAVDGLTFDGDRVTGIRGARATLVVGADGKHSTVAKAVGAPVVRHVGPTSFASYTYWSGLPQAHGTVYQRPGRVVAVFPTNDGLTMVFVSAPLAEFAGARADRLGHYLATLDTCGDLGERVRAATQAERLRTTPDVPTTVRRSHGPGWALAGDAGYVLDPITGQGIGNALQDAERLATAIVDGLGGTRPLDAALAQRSVHRDAALGPVTRLTLGLASFGPQSTVERLMLRRLARRQRSTDRFLAVTAGVLPMSEIRSVRGLFRILLTD